MRFYTITKLSKSQYTVKMSRFLAFAVPVTDAEGAKAVIADYTNQYHDARHVCWAYKVGADGSEYRSSDNGEPSGTAGKPILGQLNSFNVTNLVLVVVRYFGGIKLGTPGLISAYREAARLALEEAEIVEDRELTTVTFTFPYPVMESVMRLLKSDADIKPQQQVFDNTCRFTVTWPKDRNEELLSRLSAIEGVSVV